MAVPNPDMLSSLLGGGGGGGPQPPQAGPPAPSIQLQGVAPSGGGGGGDDPDGNQDASAISHLKRALQELKMAQQADTDPAEDAAIAKVAAQLHAVIAGRQKEKDAAIGMSPALKLAQRANQAY